MGKQSVFAVDQLWLIYDYGGNLPSIVSNKALRKLVTDQMLVFNTDVSFTSYPGNLGEFIDGEDNLNIDRGRSLNILIQNKQKETQPKGPGGRRSLPVYENGEVVNYFFLQNDNW